MSPFLTWGDFHARSRFARSIIPEEKWGTTPSLRLHGRLQEVWLCSDSTMWSEYSLLVLLVIWFGFCCNQFLPQWRGAYVFLSSCLAFVITCGLLHKDADLLTRGNHVNLVPDLAASPSLKMTFGLAHANLSLPNLFWCFPRFAW